MRIVTLSSIDVQWFKVQSCLCPLPTVLGWQVHAPAVAFYTRAWGTDSGLHTCAADISPTEPPLHFLGLNIHLNL